MPGGGRLVASFIRFSNFGKTFVSGQTVRFGFTLAEVLVTLGIIGVVSAMTVPTLMQNHQRKTYVVQLHKVYNELQQAFVQYMADRNALNLREAGITDQDTMNNFVTTYFKIVSRCSDPNDVKPCFDDPNNYKKISGNVANGFTNCQNSTDGCTFTLASGATIRPWLAGSDELAFIVAVVDVNGPKGPNVFGRDFFDMCIDVNGNIDSCLPNGTVPSFPLTEDKRDELFNSGCLGNSASIYGCFGKILNDNWQMNY